MLEIIIGFFVFCIILFFYLHIHFHLKTSNDLEIYEIEQASKDKMEEICDLRQPVLFDCDEDTEKITRTTSQSYLLDNYPIFEVKIRESNLSEAKDDENMFLPLPLHVAAKLFQDDKNATYFSEGNTEFLLETGAQKNMSYNDEFLRPFLVSNCNYDIMMGSDGVETPLRYEINYRNYFLVTQGSLKVKLAPPKSGRYLYPVKDYENLEFRAQVNPWNPQAKFRADFDKVKCLEIVLTPGKFLFIPAYWWYSFKFAENTSVSSFKYRTYMNNIAISPHIFMYALQNQNVERKTAKQIDIKTLQQKEVVENKETTNISELNTSYKKGEGEGEEIVKTSMSVKNEVTNSILETLDTETLDTENLDTLDAIKSNPFVSSI
jgi:hypothetical protein